MENTYLKHLTKPKTERQAVINTVEPLNSLDQWGGKATIRVDSMQSTPVESHGRRDLDVTWTT